MEPAGRVCLASGLKRGMQIDRESIVIIIIMITIIIHH